MATRTAMFSFLTLQILILMTSVKGDPQIEVHPPEISLGLTSSLDINCSFDSVDHPEMAGFVSLILSRANSSSQTLEDLAAVTEFSPDSVTLLTQEKVTATGVHSQTGESYLHLTWDFPTETQAGVYQCTARGLGTLGEQIEAVNISTVTEDHSNLNDIFEKLKQMELHEMALENKMTDMENTIADLEKHIQALEYNNSQMSSYIADSLLRIQRFNYLGTYEDHDYYVSKEVFDEINNVMDVCKSYGGYLVEIDNESEFNAINEYLKNASGFGMVIIAGTYDESNGTWVLQSSNKTLPFNSWADSNSSDGAGSDDCLGLIYVVLTSSWKMEDFFCKVDPPDDYYHYLCEIPRE